MSLLKLKDIINFIISMQQLTLIKIQIKSSNSQLV